MDIKNSLAAIHDSGDDPRRMRILEGALRVVLAYGFHRTTMDDIAKAAEVSRPALYLQFRNKTDIYRAVAGCLFARCLVLSRQALAGGGSLVERLDRLLEDALFGTLCEIEVTPHGPEILDMKNSLAGDLIVQWRKQMDAALEEAIAAEAGRNGVDLETRGLTARALAEVLLDAGEGARQRLADPAVRLTAAKSVARILAAAVRP